MSQLRELLGFSVQEVARSGNPVVVHRYGREHAALVPLWEWRWLKAIESAIQAGEIDASAFLARFSESGRTGPALDSECSGSGFSAKNWSPPTLAI